MVHRDAGTQPVCSNLPTEVRLAGYPGGIITAGRGGLDERGETVPEAGWEKAQVDPLAC